MFSLLISTRISVCQYKEYKFLILNLKNNEWEVMSSPICYDFLVSFIENSNSTLYTGMQKKS